MPDLTLSATLRALAEELTAAGVPTAIDPGQVPVPGGWLTPRELARPTLAGGWQATVNLWLVVHDAEESDALRALELLLGAALDVVAVDTAGGDSIDLAATLVLPHTPGTPLPAFRLTTTIEL